jgi:hypothetical protein
LLLLEFFLRFASSFTIAGIMMLIINGAAGSICTELGFTRVRRFKSPEVARSGSMCGIVLISGAC